MDSGLIEELVIEMSKFDLQVEQLKCILKRYF